MVAAMLNSVRQIKGEDVVNEVSGRIGDVSGLSFDIFADSSQHWGTRIELREVNMGVLTL